MNEDTGVNYFDPYQIGETINGLHGVGLVVKSKNTYFAPGDIVLGRRCWPWKHYFVFTVDMVQIYLTKVNVSSTIQIYFQQ